MITITIVSMFSRLVAKTLASPPELIIYCVTRWVRRRLTGEMLYANPIVTL
jgi:hypothetical protein